MNMLFCVSRLENIVGSFVFLYMDESRFKIKIIRKGEQELCKIWYMWIN